MLTLIQNGRVIDPASGRDAIGDVFIRDGRIVEPPPDLRREAVAEVIDATGLVVAPGLIDIHVHLREPGQGSKEPICSTLAAAAAGGFTSIVCMPNTTPAIDSPSVVRWVRDRAAECGLVNVHVAGAITLGLQGRDLAPTGSLHQAGVVALTDDGRCVQNHELMRRAVEYARIFELPVLDHCEEYSLVGDGLMHEGYWSLVLGLPGWPAAGEELIVLRDILLAELCANHIHCQHVSCAGSVHRLREARARGVPVSGELCPHHIAITDDALQGFDTHFKVNPPLRSPADVEALVEAVADGTLTILASDHAPHSLLEKEVEFDRAPAGMIGLETEFGLFHQILVRQRRAIDLARLIALYTVEPARLLRLPRGTLAPGAAADVTLIAPERQWTVDPERFAGHARNTPFRGWQLTGRAVRTIVGGRTVWDAGAPDTACSGNDRGG